MLHQGRHLQRVYGRFTPLLVALGVLGVVAPTLTGGAGAGLMAVAAFAMVLLAARRLALPEDRVFVVTLAGVLLSLRMLFLTVLHVALVMLGRNGALFMDDDGYMQVAAALAARWRGLPVPPEWEVFGDLSITNEYIQVAGAIYWLLGPNAIALKIFNTAIAILVGLLSYRILLNLGLPGARWAIVLIGIFPSLVLWSALALKDTYVMFLTFVALWAISEFIRHGAWRWFLLTTGALFAFATTRPYVFLIMTALWPISMLLSVRGPRRLPAFALACVAGLALLVTTPAAHQFALVVFGRGIEQFAVTRAAMSTNARTGFVDPQPVTVAPPCGRYVIEVSGRTPPPGALPREVLVDYGIDLVVEGTVPLSSRYVLVRPGDTVTVACPPAAISSTPPGTPSPPASVPAATGSDLPSPASTTPPSSEPRPLRLSLTGRNILASPAPEPAGGDAPIARSFQEEIEHFPVGLAHLLWAPFPWTMRGSDFVLLPEVVSLYVVEVFAVLGLARMSRTPLVGIAYPILVASSVFVVLSLAEGSIGTLIRHRAGVLPFLCIAAAVGIADARHRLATSQPPGSSTASATSTD